MIAIIDADIVAFRCSASVKEDEPVELAIARIDNLMQQILDETESNSYIAYISGKDNFRYKLYPDYKANRRDSVDPVYRQVCKDYLVSNWNAEVVDGIEADDALGYTQTKDTILCSIDKDLLMIPGQHYNFVKNVFTTVTQQDGLRHFWKQMLMGDTADNIIGIKGIGPVKAHKLIDPLDDEQDMFDLVYSHYNQDPKWFVTNANCLWIQRNKGELWASQQRLTLPEECEQEVVRQLDFMTSLNPTT